MGLGVEVKRWDGPRAGAALEVPAVASLDLGGRPRDEPLDEGVPAVPKVGVYLRTEGICWYSLRLAFGVPATALLDLGVGPRDEPAADGVAEP